MKSVGRKEYKFFAGGSIYTEVHDTERASSNFSLENILIDPANPIILLHLRIQRFLPVSQAQKGSEP
jgi:hypothetical protein